MVCNANDAHVSSASLDQPADMVAKLATLLSPDECQRAERFHRPTDRRRFVAARGILRKIISAYLMLATDEARFVNCWSRKESYIKAIGMGVSYPPDSFTVSLGVAPALLKVDADATEAARCEMYGLDVAEGYAA